MRLYRMMRWLYLKGFRFLPNLVRKIIRVLYSWDVFPSTDIGENVAFVHGGLGCVIHERAKIEKNAKIYQNITIGGNGKENQKAPGVPIICEGAIIYAGACVLGPIVVGKNAIIGANAVVLSDVPDNCVAIGVPAKILEKSKEVI